MKVWPYLIAPLRVTAVIAVLAWSYDNQMGWVDEYDMMAQCALGIYIFLRSDREFRRQSKSVKRASPLSHCGRVHEFAVENIS